MTTLAGITPIKDLPIENKRVFIRVDFNVPLEEQDGKQVITYDARIVEALPTIKHAIERGARLIGQALPQANASQLRVRFGERWR